MYLSLGGLNALSEVQMESKCCCFTLSASAESKDLWSLMLWWKLNFFQSKTKPNPQSKTGRWIYKRRILYVLRRLLKWRSMRTFNNGKLLLQALSLQAIWSVNQTNANENVICNFLQRASQWQHFKTRSQNLKVAFKVDDKSPTRSKIAHSSWQGLELVLCPFSDKDMSSTFFETLCRTQGFVFFRGHRTKTPFSCQGTKYRFNTDAISPATYGTPRERRGHNILGKLLGSSQPDAAQVCVVKEKRE